jgi:hypothetical protein
MSYAIFIGAAFILTVIAWLRPSHAGVCGGVLLVFAILFAGLRGASNDYGDYVTMFRDIQTSTSSLLETVYIGKDPLFGLLIMGIQAAGLGVQAVFLLSAAIALSLKAKAFSRIFGEFATPLFITLCTTYFLHEYTQMRVAIALGFAFLGLIALSERRKLLWLIFTFLAAGFHISMVAVLVCELPFVLEWDNSWALASFLGGGLAGLAAVSHIFSLLAVVSERTSEYQYGDTLSTHGLLLACMEAAVIVILNLVLLRDEVHPGRARLWKICLVLQIAGIGMFLVLADRAPGLGFRLEELMNAFGVFVITGAIFLRSYQTWALAFIYCVGAFAVVGASHLLLPYELSTQQIW